MSHLVGLDSSCVFPSSHPLLGVTYTLYWQVWNGQGKAHTHTHTHTHTQIFAFATFNILPFKSHKRSTLLQSDSFHSSCSKVGHFSVNVLESFKRLESSKPNDLTQGPYWNPHWRVNSPRRSCPSHTSDALRYRVGLHYCRMRQAHKEQDPVEDDV